MTDKIVGIKYCGGCMSKYDRSSLYKTIVETYPHIKFEYVKNDKVYDYIIIISGCESKCAHIKDLKVKNTFIHFDNNNFRKYKEILEPLINQ